MTYSQSNNPVMVTAERAIKTPLKNTSQSGDGVFSGRRRSSSIRSSAMPPHFISRTSTPKYQHHGQKTRNFTSSTLWTTAKPSTSSNSSGFSGELFSLRQRKDQFQQQRLHSYSLSSESDSGFSTSRSLDYLTHYGGKDEVQLWQQQTHAKQRQRRHSLATFDNKTNSYLGCAYHSNNQSYSNGFGLKTDDEDKLKSAALSNSGAAGGNGKSPAATIGNSQSVNHEYGARISLNNVPKFGKILPNRYSLPTALSHFATSKHFNAPSAQFLPKPPQHWLWDLMEANVEGGCAINGNSKYSEPIAVECKLAAVGYCPRVTYSESNLFDEISTHNLKLLLKVQT
ncbi:PREDICTED: uncharacterized protein LOC108377464 [Rhagoletis zephyria]|uniref:uncharacterized protein LOC108377464 n=1 Tax=Rhagoletis zephyria TaxID=28612 RepID=UPI0008114518|nr:PREDICTED: uncharacterized protein LOC108377464 [Rhagoletis zephyria]